MDDTQDPQNEIATDAVQNPEPPTESAFEDVALSMKRSGPKNPENDIIEKSELAQKNEEDFLERELNGGIHVAPKPQNIPTPIKPTVGAIPRDMFPNTTPATPPLRPNLQDEISSIGGLGIKKETPLPEKNKIPIDHNLKQIRTYEGDVAEILAHTNVSTTSIALAENRKKGTDSLKNTEDTRDSTHSFAKILLLLTSVVFIAVGLYGGYYFYMQSPFATKTPAVQPQTTISEGIVPSDQHVSLPIDSLTGFQLVSQLKTEFQKPLPSGSITEIIPMMTLNGTLTKVPASQMISTLGINAPDILVRTVTPTWMLGMYSDPSGNQSAFVIVTTDFFQNAFTGMLQWERLMPDDLKQYLYIKPPMGISGFATTTPVVDPLVNIESILPVVTHATTSVSRATSTKTTNISSTKSTSLPTLATSTNSATTSTSTTESQSTVQPYDTIHGHYEDRIVKNKDVREFKTSDGTIVFLYSFIDNTHHVITNTEATHIEILTRLEKKGFVR